MDSRMQEDGYPGYGQEQHPQQSSQSQQHQQQNHHHHYHNHPPPPPPAASAEHANFFDAPSHAHDESTIGVEFDEHSFQDPSFRDDTDQVSADAVSQAARAAATALAAAESDRNRHHQHTPHHHPYQMQQQQQQQHDDIGTEGGIGPMRNASPASASLNASTPFSKHLGRNRACQSCRERKLKCDGARPICEFGGLPHCAFLESLAY